MASDEELYARARAGDLGAYDALYARYERRLFAFILRCIGDRPAAEEIFHDVFLRVMTGSEAHFAQARFVAWLFRIARNACASHQRSERRGQRALERLEAEPAWVSSPEDRLESEERASQLARALEGLPSTLADIFALRTSGLSYDEIADALDIPLGTVKSRMNALVTQLRGELLS